LYDPGSAFAKSDDGGLMPELAPSSGLMPVPELSPSGGLMPMPELSPSGSPKPFVPFLAPSPLAPFFNNSTPKLSGIKSFPCRQCRIGTLFFVSFYLLKLV
jgi:hypothetical protein